MPPASRRQANVVIVLPVLLLGLELLPYLRSVSWVVATLLLLVAVVTVAVSLLTGEQN